MYRSIHELLMVLWTQINSIMVYGEKTPIKMKFVSTEADIKLEIKSLFSFFIYCISSERVSKRKSVSTVMNP